MRTETLVERYDSGNVTASGNAETKIAELKMRKRKTQKHKNKK